MKFKTRFDINLIAGEIADGLIIDNDNGWNDNKMRANERHELAKSRFRNYNKRNKNINIQIRCGISIYERKIKGEKIFKENENSYIISDLINK
jgi:hypothetical protein